MIDGPRSIKTNYSLEDARAHVGVVLRSPRSHDSDGSG